MAQNGVHDLAPAAGLGKRGQFWQRRRNGILVLGSHQGNHQPSLFADRRCPDIGAEQRRLALDPSPVGDERAQLTVADFDVGHRSLGKKTDPADPGRFVGQRTSHMPSQHIGVQRRIKRALDHLGVEQRQACHALFGREQMGFHAVAGGNALFALQIFQPFGGVGHLKATDPAHRRAASLVFRQLAVNFDRLDSETGHHSAGVGHMHAAGGMAGRPIVVGQVTFVDHQDILPAQSRQLIGGVASDDAAADDDQPCGGRQSTFSHRSLLLSG